MQRPARSGIAIVRVAASLIDRERLRMLLDEEQHPLVGGGIPFQHGTN
jgi:hypothetical protein